jgi:hypothetical protein
MNGAAGAAEAPTMKTTVTNAPKKKKLRSLEIEPADNGYTVQARHHEDYMTSNGPPKPKVFEKKNGHEMLKHVARKLGIKAKISEPDANAAAEPSDNDGDE